MSCFTFFGVKHLAQILRLCNFFDKYQVCTNHISPDQLQVGEPAFCKRSQNNTVAEFVDMQVWGLIREAFREGFTIKRFCSFGFCPNYIYLSWRKFADSLLEFGNSRRDLDKNTEFSTWNLQISSRQELLFSFDDENCPTLSYKRENARIEFQ